MTSIIPTIDEYLDDDYTINQDDIAFPTMTTNPTDQTSTSPSATAYSDDIYYCDDRIFDADDEIPTQNPTVDKKSLVVPTRSPPRTKLMNQPSPRTVTMRTPLRPLRRPIIRSSPSDQSSDVPSDRAS
jgi:hypothetical protein